MLAAMPDGGLDKRYVNDRWTLDIETLGFDRLAWEVARKALYCQPPFAQCVVGRWGSGKTSVMRYAMALLGGEMPVVRVESTTKYEREEHRDQGFGGSERIKTLFISGRKAFFPDVPTDDDSADDEPSVYNEPTWGDLHFVPASANGLEKEAFGVVTTLWFSPWRFQHEPNPMVPLLHQIRDHFSQWAKSQDHLERAAKLAIAAGLAQLGKLADTAAKLAWGFELGASGAIEAAKRAAAKLDKETYATLTDAERFNLQFEAAIRTILNAKSCAKEDARLPHRLIIFIDDLDRVEDQAVVRLLEALKLYLSTEQCVFVFGLDLTVVENAIHNYWGKRPRPMAREYLDKLFQSYVYMPTTGNYAQIVQNHLQAWNLLEESQTASEEAQKIAEILPRNPRKVKNFLNSMRLAARLCNLGSTKPPDPRELVALALVHRLRTSAPHTASILLEEGPGTAWNEFANLAGKGRARDVLDEVPSSRLAQMFLSDFAHLFAPAADEGASALDNEDLRVRIDRIGADRRFLEMWIDENISFETFQRWTVGEVNP